ncbi:MAG: hypothetical protein GX362_02855 [Methanosarcinaceae archaeon]|nr:hypothetical protein [Methanosarcinaceae archaeon]
MGRRTKKTDAGSYHLKRKSRVAAFHKKEENEKTILGHQHQNRKGKEENEKTELGHQHQNRKGKEENVEAVKILKVKGTTWQPLKS